MIKLRSKIVLLFVSLYLAAVAHGLVVRNVPWKPEYLASINNQLDISLNSQLVFTCNTTQNIHFGYSQNQVAYENCDTSQFSELGVCSSQYQTVSSVVQVGIPGGVPYQEGAVVYFISTTGSDCSNGYKIAVTILAEATTTSTTTTSTVTPTTSTVGVVNPPTGTTTPTGATTTTTSTTVEGGGRSSTVTIISSSTSNSVTITSSPTPGGVDDDTGSQTFLEKLPFDGYLVLPLIVIAVLILLCGCVTFMTCVYCCHRKKHHQVKTLNSTEKGDGLLLKDTNLKGNEYTADGQSGRGHDPPHVYDKIKEGPNRKPPEPPTTGSEKSSKSPDPLLTKNGSSNGIHKSSPRGPTSLRSAPPPPPSNNGPTSLPARIEGRRQAPRPPPAASGRSQRLPPI